MAKFKVEDTTFIWVLYLGVIPLDKAALTFYNNIILGNYIALLLNVIVVLYVLFLISRRKTVHKVTVKYVLWGIATLTAYVGSCLYGNELYLYRILSIGCLFAYYFFIIEYYHNIRQFFKDINKALGFIILLSVCLYYLGSENVIYYESADKVVFKGIVPNRNVFSEISLFYITTNFCIYIDNTIYFLLTTSIAVWATCITNSATSLICLSVLLTLYYFSKYNLVKAVCMSKKIFWIPIIAFIGVVGMNGMIRNIISYVSSLFGKSATLTGRTDIWNITIEKIIENPFFGYGYDSMVLFENGVRVNDPHNGILYLVLTGGIISLMIFLVMMASSLLKNKTYTNLSEYYLYIRVFIIIWLLKGLVESVFSYSHFIFWSAVIALDLLSYNRLEKGFDIND